MKDTPISNTRNFAVFGHTGSGKTTLIDAILYKLGINDRMGMVDAGNSMADYTNEEKSHKITIFAKPFCAPYKTKSGKNMNMVFTDAPGYMDFFGQAISAMKSTETGLLVVDASSGVQVGTNRAWRGCSKQGIDAKAIVITGLDKDNTDFSKTLQEITSAFGDHCVPVTLPLADGSGVIDVLAAKDVPADIQDQVTEVKGKLVELVI